MLRYLQGTKDYMLTFWRTDNLEVADYSDIDFAGCKNTKRSTSGYIFMLANGHISWKSHKQSLTASSTTEAEFIAYYKATCHVIWLKNFISGLHVVDSISKSLSIYCDNNAAVRFSNNNIISGGSKHIDIKGLVVK